MFSIRKCYFLNLEKFPIPPLQNQPPIPGFPPFLAKLFYPLYYSFFLENLIPPPLWGGGVSDYANIQFRLQRIFLLSSEDKKLWRRGCLITEKKNFTVFCCRMLRWKIPKWQLCNCGLRPCLGKTKYQKYNIFAYLLILE